VTMPGMFLSLHVALNFDGPQTKQRLFSQLLEIL